jgi:hypothetical protein
MLKKALFTAFFLFALLANPITTSFDIPFPECFPCPPVKGV